MLKQIARDSRGNCLYVEPNGVGGHRYWSDDIGGGVAIWDTCLGSVEMIELAIKHESRRTDCAQCGGEFFPTRIDARWWPEAIHRTYRRTGAARVGGRRSEAATILWFLHPHSIEGKIWSPKMLRALPMSLPVVD